MHIHIFAADCLADSFPRCSAIMILAVTDSLLEIGFHQALHDTRMRSFVIVTLKLVHMSAVLSETNISNSFVFSVSLLNKTKSIMTYFPKDPAMLMSWINLKLRDFYGNLDDLCEDLEIDRNEVETILKQAGFEYNDELHKVW